MSKPKFSPFETSYWFASAPPAPNCPALDQEVQADVCIVGGGYTGLTTAIELARQGVKVALLEREQIGYGGSGRNAGHCSPTFSYYPLDKVRALVGQPYAERLIKRQTGAAEQAADYIARYGIDCEWQQNGLVIGAMRPGHIASLQHKTESYNAVGAKTRVIERDEMVELTGTPRSFGGWYHPQGAHLHPLKYARGLARGAISEGVSIYAGTSALSCDKLGGKWKVGTEKGAVVADKVIFATGAYTVPGWPKLEQSFQIMPVYVAATNQLSDHARKVMLPANTSMLDGRGDFYCYKWSADNRIIASMFLMGPRGRDLDYTRKVMTAKLKWLHPQVKDEIRWDYLWFGELDMQYKTTPRLYGLAPGVVALTGLSGRGVPTGTMLGGVLSEWAMGVPETDLSLPIEPLHKAPYWMKHAPNYKLREMRAIDNLSSRIGGVTLPPFA
ncbi:FAD-binding oxidoreductase [Xinfangfangia sp. CPCC 101601]|uniref:FAD-binding oxidoreductase n=1 Tax=Pseudogemmobacter lacusdianii TaxID=3069608 RepID=A0ABU0W3T5_9RHOB|nr:FAD-binding oxidoreductase [Xinfangfangia sp. CPCC 101601]MDQ2068125.1 FAD-binding oxidoreductase [Xinfangfangia sp. CPCC 101601]